MFLDRSVLASLGNDSGRYAHSHLLMTVTTMTKTSTVASLAILKVNADVLKKDYLENFIPFILQCIKDQPDDVISVPYLQSSLKQRFGFSIPQNVIAPLLRRASRAKYLRRENHVYYRNAPNLDSLPYEALQVQVISQYDKLIELLVSYCKERFKRVLSNDEAEQALLAYIDENQIEIVGIRYTNSIMPRTDYPSQEAKYLVGSFVHHLLETKSSFFDFLETVVRGNMLANAIFLPDISQSSTKFRETTVYFDTSFLLFALGHAGDTLQAPCLELISLLKKVDAKLSCFNHTIDECRGILDACALKLASGQLKDIRGPSLPYFLVKHYTKTDVLVFSENVQRDIEALGIIIVQKPDYKDFQYVNDEAELEGVLNQPDPNTMKWRAGLDAYSNPLALKRDVDSISAIMRLRRGIVSYHYEDCGAIFITTNHRLNRIARGVFYKETQSEVIPPCQTDQAFTNIIWLKQPNNAPELPRKRVIADCYSAIQPSERLFRVYFNEIERLKERGSVTEEEYYTLRYTLEARNALMELTLGVEDAFTEGTIGEILEFVKENMLREAEERHNETLAVKQKELEEASSENQALQQSIQWGIQREIERKQRIRYRAERVGKLVSQSLFWTLFVIVVITTFFTFPWGFPDFSLATQRYIRFAFLLMLVVLFIFSASNMVFGTRVLDVTNWLKEKISDVAEKVLLKIGS